MSFSVKANSKEIVSSSLVTAMLLSWLQAAHDSQEAGSWQSIMLGAELRTIISALLGIIITQILSLLFYYIHTGLLSFNHNRKTKLLTTLIASQTDPKEKAKFEKMLQKENSDYAKKLIG